MTTQSLDYVAYFYVTYLSLPDTLISAIATTRVHLPTWASTVSDPESPSSTRGRSPTWESLVSVPACQLPTLSSLFLPVTITTVCQSLHQPPHPPLDYRESSRVTRSCFSAVSWRYHASLLRPPPAYPVSLSHTSNKGHSATNCATVACRRPM